MKNNCCKNCKYYLELISHNINSSGPTGECHRYPQETIIYSAEHWCGEFEEKAENKPKKRYK